ncbi:MAG: glucose-6-phosphate isomerase [Deltaproteobacteria bacterium]|nr:glucose-6-phosphate isomerase [Deltaproteobacteria bacterium]
MSSAASSVSLDVNGFFSHMIGSYGLDGHDLERIEARLAAALAHLDAKRLAGDLPFYDLPYDDDAIAACKGLAAELRAEFDTLIVLGIGGSALGTKAVLEGVPAASLAAGMRVVVADNIDPATFSRLLGGGPGGVDLSRTAFNVISKSGGTAETLAQFLIARERLLAHPAVGAARWARHIVVTTDPARGPLRALAAAEGFRSLPVPPGVGGRFSVLTSVGLLPLAAAGVDIEALCAGARHADTLCSLSDPRANPAALHAGLLFLALREKGCAVHVLMPYSDGLLRLAEWYAQLWAESLGKAHALDGSVVETGQTPVRALGATDQHSQVQLYVEGPRDKVVTFVRVDEHDGELTIPGAYPDKEEIAYLSGLRMGDLLNMEQRATELALAESGRPTSVLTIGRSDARSIGYLFHFFEVQTLVMGALLGIDPLDQPGVEAGKRLTYGMAGRAGYAADAQRVQSMLARKRDDLVLG